MGGGLMKKIIAAIDNSAASRPVLTVGLALAPVLGATVEAVHVSDEEGLTARGAADALGVLLHVLPGDPLQRIAALALDPDIVAIVIGAHAYPRAREPAGHTALAVCYCTDKPVVLVTPDAEPPHSVERVVVGMEGTPRQARRLERAIELAAADLDIVVVHVDDETTIPSFSDQVQYETEAYGEEFLARYVPGSAKARFEPRIGIAADEILAVAHD